MRWRPLPCSLALAISLLMLSALAPVRAADAPPRFDIRRNCQLEISGGAGIGETLESCIRDEQQARDELAGQWSAFTPADRTSCIRETSIDGTPSYVELQTCLEMLEGPSGRRK